MRINKYISAIFSIILMSFIIYGCSFTETGLKGSGLALENYIVIELEGGEQYTIQNGELQVRKDLVSIEVQWDTQIYEPSVNEETVEMTMGGLLEPDVCTTDTTVDHLTEVHETVIRITPQEELINNRNYTIAFNDLYSTDMTQLDPYELCFRIESGLFPSPTTVSPANETLDNARNSQIVVTFSKDMDNTTINDDNFIVMSDGSQQDGTFSFSGPVTWTPDDLFGNCSDVEVTLTTDITDTYRNPLDQEYTINFGILCLVWYHPVDLADSISPNNQASATPRVAVDNNRNSIIVWPQSDGANYQIFMSEYRDGSWTHPAGLSDNISPDGSTATESHVAMSDNGDAVIVWRQSDGADYQVFKSEYRSGSWTPPSGLSDNISIDGNSIVTPRVAMSDNGDTVIIWQQSDGANQQVFMSEYRSGSWTHPTGLSDNISPNGQNALAYGVAMGDNGDAVIIWSQSDGADSQIFMSEYRSGSWTHPTGLSDNISPDGQNVDSANVAMDNIGDTIIVWQQSDGSIQRIFKSEYRSGTWTDPTDLNDNISPDGQSAFNPDVAMDDGGNAIIIWRQSDGANQQVFKSEYRSGGWTHPASVTDNISPAGSSVVTPRVAMSDIGDAIIVWRQPDGAADQQVFMSEYRDEIWTHPADLSDNISPDGQSVGFPNVAMDNIGITVIVWSQSNGTIDRIFMSEYR